MKLIKKIGKLLAILYVMFGVYIVADESTNPPTLQRSVSKINVTVCSCKEIQDAADWMFNQLNLIDYSLQSAPKLISNLKKEALRLHCRERFITGYYTEGVFIVSDTTIKDDERIWQ